MINNAIWSYYINSPWKDSVFCWYPFEDGVVYETVIDPPDFSLAALVAYREKLGGHGRLLLAYENPFALRYWAGKRAPNTGNAYDTLFKRGENPLPDKQELQTRLTQAGFMGQKWYYPLTDHYFTREVYSDAYMPDQYFNQRFSPYLLSDPGLVFDERPLYREIVQGGAFTFMCGAYLVEARVCADDAPCPVDYAAVTVYRDIKKRFATTVRNDGTVWKTPLHPDTLGQIEQIQRNHQELAALGVNVLPMAIQSGALVMQRMEHPILWDYWADKLANATFDESEMYAQFDRIRDAIKRAGSTGKCYWELVPANCFYDKGKDELIFFDQEFFWEGVSTDVAVTRAICAINISPALRIHPHANKWLDHLKKRYDLMNRWEKLYTLARLETYTEVFGSDNQALENITAEALKQIREQERYQRFLPVVRKLHEMGCTHPVIYGYGTRGKTLRHVLEDHGIPVSLMIDQQCKTYQLIDTFPLDTLCDSIIVSPLHAQAIADELKSKINMPIYTLGELLGE